MSFIHLKGNCPLCDGARKDCRQNKQNGIVHCRANLNIIPSGWKALGQDKWGFEMYAPASNEQSSLGWQERQRERKLHQQREKEELAKGALSESDRDKAIRRIHGYLGLAQRHRQNLRDRGLTDAHIDRLPYFSFHSDQEVPQFTPANLPGVKRGKLAVNESGFACPIPNIDGQFIGWQNRFDAATNGKYRWPSGQKSAHLPNGELPIGVYRPDSGVTRRAIGHSEGFLKTHIIAQQWGLPTLGAASANFAASPEQWQDSLEKLSAELWTRIIYWFADAGAVANPNVTGQYLKSWEKLAEWGYSVKVVWWHQVEKSAGDADEISQEARESARLISIDQYLAIARRHGGISGDSSSYTSSIQGIDTEVDRPISRDEWELTFGFGRRLRERVKLTLEGFRGFAKSPAPKLVPKETPDRTFQDANQRLRAWQDAAAKGYRYVLDASAPGLGKSHAAGLALPDAFGAEKLWYISTDHRNPTTGIIESNYIDLPVRHGGLKIDDTRKTPNGSSFLVHPKPGEEPDTRANCYRTPLFRAFAAKGYRYQESAKSSDICGGCKVAHLCKQGIGIKYGATFRGERASALSSDRIRAHADSLPSSDEFNYSISGLIWDEAGTHLKAMDEIPVSLEEFDRTWAEVESRAPDLHEQLKALRLALRRFLTGELKQPYHGWDDAAIRALLPEKPDNLSETIASLDALLQPDLGFLKQKAEFVSADDAKRMNMSRGMKALINEQFRREANEEFQEAFNRLPLNWLVPFLKIWNGQKGALRSERGTLTVFVGSDRHAAVAQAAKFNIFLDATIDRNRLALLLGIDPSEIYVVGQETPNHGNLKIVQVTGMGKLGKDRSDSLKDRVAALRKGLEERYPGIVFGDWKSHAETGDGQWFVNLRGSNEFQNAPTMAVFGVPYQNVGYLQALYQTLTGEFAPLDRETPHEGLQRFIETHVQAELEQGVGRLRSHLRPNEHLTFLIVGDYDLSFLGMPVEQVEAFQIAPEAGTPAQITRWKILEAARTLNSQRGKLTQDAIASLIGKSQELISKIAKELGGWKRLKKLLLTLLNPLYSGSNNFAGLTDEEKWIAQTYLPGLLDESPEAAVQELAEVVRACGVSGFLQILTAATPQTQARILALVMQALPLGFQSELLMIFIEGGG